MVLTTRNIPIPGTTQRHLRLGPPQQRPHGLGIVPVWLYGWRGRPSCGRWWWREGIDGTEAVFVFDSLRCRGRESGQGRKRRGEGGGSVQWVCAGFDEGFDYG